MDTFEVIGAFVDRERVDPELLKQALSTDEGREYLVDLVALREVTAGQTPAADIAIHDRPGSRARAFAIAAALVLSVAGGYLAGQRQAEAISPAATPVVVDRPVPAAIIPAAPAPTTIIKLEPGAEWKESAGG